jgi:hypothetical protein
MNSFYSEVFELEINDRVNYDFRTSPLNNSAKQTESSSNQGSLNKSSKSSLS